MIFMGEHFRLVVKFYFPCSHVMWEYGYVAIWYIIYVVSILVAAGDCEGQIYFLKGIHTDKGFEKQELSVPSIR